MDVTQYVSRLDEATRALLPPRELPDLPNAPALPPGPREVVFEDVTFAYAGRALSLIHI